MSPQANAAYAKGFEGRNEQDDGSPEKEGQTTQAPKNVDPPEDYAATGTFNRITGHFQNAAINPELHNAVNESRRQMSAFFDVDAAANSHDGRSLKAIFSAFQPGTVSIGKRRAETPTKDTAASWLVRVTRDHI
jgi:hypothetical protein